MNFSKTLEIKEKRAVLVGIDDYLDTSIGKLKYAVDDVGSLHKILVDQERGKYNPSLTYLITSDNKDETLVPLKSNIMSAIKTMSRTAGTEDSILLFFSGHGVEREGRAYLLPYEARTNVLTDTAIPIDWIKDTMAKSDARGKVIIFDACHAGLHLGKTTPEPMTKAFEEAISKESEGFAILASCKMNELSHEWEEKKHGVFTYYLNEGLSGVADTDQDGVITISEASRYVSEKVKNWAFQRGFQQNPTLYYQVSGDLSFVYIPGGAMEKERIQKPELTAEGLDKYIAHISLRWITGGGDIEPVYSEKWASDLCALLLKYFPLETIKEIRHREYAFPLGRIYWYRDMEENFYHRLDFKYSNKKRTLISNIISDLDDLNWTSLAYHFSKRFDHTKIVNWLKTAGMDIQSYKPGVDPSKDMSIEVSATGWGREGVPAEVVFTNDSEGSGIYITQKTKSGRDEMEPNFFDKLYPLNILGLIGDIFVEAKE